MNDCYLPQTEQFVSYITARREQGTFRCDDDNGPIVLDQHSKLGFA